MVSFFKKKKKKVYDKWFLLIFSTLVIFVGIGNELLKGTRSLSQIPANPAFDDINFYKCVVDEYNDVKNPDVSYDTNLTDEQLKTITSLSCLGYIKSDDEKIKSVKGLEKLTEITELDVSKNQITEIDVSQNTALTYLDVYSNQLTELNISNNTALKNLSAFKNQITTLDVSNNQALTNLSVYSNQLTTLDVSNNQALTELYISDNPFSENLYVYKGNKINVGNNVKIPSHLNFAKPTWTSKDINIATVDNNGLVTSVESGNVNIVGVTNKYTTTSTINVVEIISDKYVIDEESFLIVVDSNSFDYSELINNIAVSNDNINLKIYNGNNEITSGGYIEGTVLRLLYNDDVIEEFEIVEEYLKFDESLIVDEDNKYIYMYGSNTKVADLLEKIKTSGKVNIYDKDDSLLSGDNFVMTGIKLVVELSEDTYEYTIILSGDVNGDGNVDQDDIDISSRHIVVGDIVSGDEYIRAIDFDNNNKIDINDIVKIARYIKNSGDTNE